MKRRKKSLIEYYDRRMQKMFTDIPESKLVENRYKALRYMLQEKYGVMFENQPKEFVRDFLKDVVSLDRELRRGTEYLQKTKKEILSQEYIVEHYDLSPVQQ